MHTHLLHHLCPRITFQNHLLSLQTDLVSASSTCSLVLSMLFFVLLCFYFEAGLPVNDEKHAPSFPFKSKDTTAHHSPRCGNRWNLQNYLKTHFSQALTIHWSQESLLLRRDLNMSEKDLLSHFHVFLSFPLVSHPFQSFPRNHFLFFHFSSSLTHILLLLSFLVLTHNHLFSLFSPVLLFPKLDLTLQPKCVSCLSSQSLFSGQRLKTVT